MKFKRQTYKKHNRRTKNTRTRHRRTKNTKNTRTRHRKEKTIGGDLNPDIKNTVSRLIQDREQNMGRMLNVACKNPGNCLALGVYGSYIKQYFDNFRNLSLVDNPKIKRIGTASGNGFIIEVPFTKNSFTAYTALKCSAKPGADNLFYEYYVGKFFINNYLNIFPCFVETYDCYTFNDERSWSMLKNLPNSKDNEEEEDEEDDEEDEEDEEDDEEEKGQVATNPNDIDLKNMITRKNISEKRISGNNYDSEDNEMFGLSCEENKRLCVLIQHFDNFRSLMEEYEKNVLNTKLEIFNILYQAYFPLTILKDVYTHYDLHANNVFLYKPYDGKNYVQMRYHLISGRIIEFPSEYIVKIIDYGRNYFDNGLTNTKAILNNYVCNNTRCNPDCGKEFGYSVIQGDEYNPKAMTKIFPNKKNISQDLRFAAHFYSFLKTLDLFDTFFYGNKYGSTTIVQASQTGTPEKLGGDNRNIHNIVNFRSFLEAHIDNWNNVIAKIKIKKYKTWQKKATMDIYEDKRPYTFVVLPDKS
jgi:hypothetical protein